MWHAKKYGGYQFASQEAIDNATEVCSYLLSKDYTLEACCAILGNIGGEGALNPWRWEADSVPTVSVFESWTDEEARHHGYGLVGFTPANRYINAQNATALDEYGYAPNFEDSIGEPEDGLAQTVFFESEIEHTFSISSPSWALGYYIASFQQVLGFTMEQLAEIVDISYNDFKTDDSIPLENLTGVFELRYEKPRAEVEIEGTTYYPAASSYPNRVSIANYYCRYFQDNPPPGWNPLSKESTWKFYLFI